jgi:hypothetical protein
MQESTVNEFVITRTSSSKLADLGPLPEVRECNRETTWKLFLALQAGGESFPQTQPFTSDLLVGDARPAGSEVTVQAVLNEARRNNRVAPKDAHWKRLRELLAEVTGLAPPPCAPTSGSVPRLVKRMLLRDQIEWAADYGYLALTMRFFQDLPEEHWLHMG